MRQPRHHYTERGPESDDSGMMLRGSYPRRNSAALERAKPRINAFADQQRQRHLLDPDELNEMDELQPARYSQFSIDNDFIWVRETPHYFVYSERWIENRLLDDRIIRVAMPLRMKVIGDALGLTIQDFHYEKGIMWAVFKK